jgi:hypothetical protein
MILIDVLMDISDQRNERTIKPFKRVAWIKQTRPGIFFIPSLKDKGFIYFCPESAEYE